MLNILIPCGYVVWSNGQGIAVETGSYVSCI